MMPDGSIVLAILAMAAAAYGTKAAGVALLSARRMPAYARAVLRHSPGAVILAIVAPIVVAGGLPMAVGAGVAVVVSVWTRNLIAAALTGVLAAGVLVTLLSP